VRRKELRELSVKKIKILKGIRYIFLKNPSNWTERQKTRFHKIQLINSKTSQAWLFRKNFREYFNSQSLNDAKYFFTGWINNAK